MLPKHLWVHNNQNVTTHTNASETPHHAIHLQQAIEVSKPFIRTSYKSRPIDIVLDEFDNFASPGVLLFMPPQLLHLSDVHRQLVPSSGAGDP